MERENLSVQKEPKREPRPLPDRDEKPKDDPAAGKTPSEDQSSRYGAEHFNLDSSGKES